MSARRIAILFDIDGTLITSGGAGTRAWALAFDDVYNLDVDISLLSDMGMTDSEVGIKSFESVKNRKPSSEELDFLLERRLHFLTQAIAESEGYRVLPGVEELLVKLIGEGYQLGLVSGNDEVGAHIKLKRANLNRFFCFGGYGSDSPDRAELTKAALSKAEMVHGGQLQLSDYLAVGDTPRDVEAAHSAGIECVGVASSKFSVKELLKAGADFAIESLVEGLPL